MKTLILNVGNEVLSGKVINTNASFLSLELEKIGIDVEKVVTVGDNKEELVKEINLFLNSDFDYLITTGGLGPTHDDFTKEVLFETIGLELTMHKEAVDLLEKYFDSNYAKCNLKQTMYPKDAILLKNDLGTAMGAYCEHNNKCYTILVGPPFELKPMVTNYLLPILKKKVNCTKVIKEYIIMGIGESQIEEYLADYFKKYSDIEINPYCSIGKVRYQLTGSTLNLDRFNSANEEFIKLMDKYIVSNDTTNIENKVVDKLKELNYHISFAESVTGGALSSRLISVSGSSSVINESYVTYSNEAKMKLLGVNKETIDTFDVVSKEVVNEMVNGLYKLTNSEVCVSVSGYAGPGGGTPLIPVGTCHFAIKINDNVYTYSKVFKGDRNTIRERAVMLIFYYIYLNLKNIKF